jgi:hypothetical protein
MSYLLNTASITKALLQLQGVEHALVHPVASDPPSFTVLVWIDDACIESSVASLSDLDQLLDGVECHVTLAVDDKKRSIKFRITH